ncbi:MAG: serine/threonine-protein kinase [Sandaracinaceae bacterium]
MSAPSPSDRVGFLRHRLSLFAKWSFLTVGTGLVVRLVLALYQGALTALPLDLAGHVLAGLVMLIAWQALARRPWTRASLIAIEAVAVHLLSGCLVLMGLGMPPQVHPELIMLLGMLLTMSLRSIYVPSTERWTLALCASIGVWLLVNAWVTAQRFEGIPDADHFNHPRALLINVAVWWSFVTLVNTLAARVIYGLREEIREARQLGQYTLEEKLGEGGMGVVYRAHHAMLRRPTAVKLLPPDLAGDQAILRFEREVRRTASLAHPNIVTVFDYGRTDDGIFYYAMELLEGLDLAALVHRFGPQPPARVQHVLAQICEGLAEAHAVGLIHRDIKPANVFLVQQGRAADRVKVVDFGLVRDVGSSREASLTGAESIAGTPHYMAPEAITSPDRVDARSDLYAVGAVGYYLLTGAHVFEGKSLVALAAQHLDAKPVPPSERLGAPLPEVLEEVILRCLEKDPALRPQSATELRELLEVEQGLPPWRDEDAARWWTEHQASLHSERADVASLPTLDIDFRGRDD